MTAESDSTVSLEWPKWRKSHRYLISTEQQGKDLQPIRPTGGPTKRRQESSSAEDETGVDLELAGSNLNRSVTLIGSNLAVFTFALFFLYPRYASNQLNGVLFQMTLGSSLVAIFLFGICGVFYFEAVGVAKTSMARKRMLVRRGDTLFVLSLLLGTAEPALILFTLGILPIAILAALLWALFAGFIIQQGRKLRAP